MCKVGRGAARTREREGTRVEHYITILPFHYGIKLIGSLLWKVPWNWSLDLCQTPNFPLPGPGAGLCLPSHLVPFRSPAAGDIIHMPRPGFYEKKIQNLQNTCPALNEQETILVGARTVMCNVGTRVACRCCISISTVITRHFSVTPCWHGHQPPHTPQCCSRYNHANIYEVQVLISTLASPGSRPPPASWSYLLSRHIQPSPVQPSPAQPSPAQPARAPADHFWLCWNYKFPA